jgi:glucan phosphorylase
MTSSVKSAVKNPLKKSTKTSVKVTGKSKPKAAVLPKLSPVDQALQNHLIFSSFKTSDAATPRDWYEAASYTVRDHVVERWVKTAEAYYRDDPKRVYYLSLEFLIGRMLSNAALNLGINDQLKTGLSSLGRDLENTVEMENDAALGNGGLGRLAACFLDSMATMAIPATGYGIRYEYGMFKQTIENGQQVENPDNWCAMATSGNSNAQKRPTKLNFTATWSSTKPNPVRKPSIGWMPNTWWPWPTMCRCRATGQKRLTACACGRLKPRVNLI